MTEISFPDGVLYQITTLDVDTPAQQNRSDWTGRAQSVGIGGAETWQGAINIEAINTELDERPWRVFLISLRGVTNWFRLPLPKQNHYGPRPVVGAGSGEDYTLPLTGMTPNIKLLETGQYMTVPLPSGHNRLVMLMQDLRSDASGNATAVFEPSLNEAPTQGTTVETINPFVPMRSTERRLGLNTSGGTSGRQITLEEAL